MLGEAPQPQLTPEQEKEPKHRIVTPKFSVLKARTLSPSATYMNMSQSLSRINGSRQDRKGHVIDETTREHQITFADDVKEVKVNLADVKVVESYKEHNYDNTHEASYPICPCCALM